MGDVGFQRIDDLDLDYEKILVIKVDVEGGEIDVIDGSLASLRRAQEFIVVFEANGRVFQRTQVDPITIIERVRSIRPCRFYVAEAPSVQIDLTRRFFDQFPSGHVFNVIVECLATSALI